MKTIHKMSGADRRTAIIRAARDQFAEHGFHRTTTRQLAEAAGVSEALVFKHFPTKEALFVAIQASFFKDEAAKMAQWLDSVQPSTAALVFLVRDLVSHVLGEDPEPDKQLFFRLVLRSLMDEGGFTRMALESGPARWVKKIEQCISAAQEAGDLLAPSVTPCLGGWIVHQLISGFMIHDLPRESVIDYGAGRGELVDHVVAFCLRGIGLSDEAIRRCDHQTPGRPTNGVQSPGVDMR